MVKALFLNFLQIYKKIEMASILLEFFLKKALNLQENSIL